MSPQPLCLLLPIALLLSLAACAVQPETHADLPKTVQTVAPDAWSVDAPQASVNADAWWNDFGDPVMHELVTSVLDGNLDVQAAAERVKQAQSIATQRHADLLPELDAVARAADTRQNTPPPLGYVRQAGVGLAASWAPDVFGGEHLALLAAQAQVSGRKEALNAVRLALAANAAAAYIDLRWAQSQMQIVKDNEQIRSRALRLTQERLHYGLSTQLDVARVRASTRSAGTAAAWIQARRIAARFARSHVSLGGEASASSSFAAMSGAAIASCARRRSVPSCAARRSPEPSGMIACASHSSRSAELRSR